MIKKMVSMALVVPAAAAAAIFLGWLVTAPLQKPALASATPVQAAAAAEQVAPAPAAQPGKGRSEPVASDATAGSDRGGFRLETRTTKLILDPMRGKASLDVTPSFNITLDAGKREASLDAGTVHLGIGR